jgi:UDP-GlcNAc:undecaprenyl-phosphate GlcNAc-1-phosphate transferase
VIGLELAGGGAVLSIAFAAAALRRPGPLDRPNHRGTIVPAVLGLVVVSAAATAVLGVALERASRSGRVVITGRVEWVSLAVAIVFTAGLMDDLSHGGPRGLRGHFAALLDRRLTTGLAKLAAALGAGALVAVVVPHRSVLERIAGVVLMAGAANLLNGLDVAPGRAAKAFLLAGAGVLAGGPAWATAVPLLTLYGAEVPAAWLDLRERAMLGDAGANALGFALGAGLYTVLQGWGIVVAGGVAIGLNVVAETVTLSRVIDALSPLRWFDRVGRPSDRKKSARTD